MKVFAWASLFFGLVLSPCAADVTFESDDDILVVRGVQQMGFAVYEILGSSDGAIRCVAMDEGGKPLAVATGFVEIGAIMFPDLDVKEVGRVACKYQN